MSPETLGTLDARPNCRIIARLVHHLHIGRVTSYLTNYEGSRGPLYTARRSSINLPTVEIERLLARFNSEFRPEKEKVEASFIFDPTSS